MMPPQYATASFPQYGAMPQPQFAAAPAQFAAPQPKFAAPQLHFANAPQQFVPQPMNAAVQHPPQVAKQFAAPAYKQPAVPAIPPVTSAPAAAAVPAAAPLAVPPASRPFAPSGAEMLQVTVFGVQGIEGVTNPTVKVEVPGKHNFQIDTSNLDVQGLNPKSTITYVKPGDGLIFSVIQGDQLFGQAQVNSEDFFPNGFEGEVVVGHNGEAIAVKLAVLADGQIQQLAPVVVKSTASAPVESAPVIAGTSAPRLCSPEEFQWACNQPGAAAPLTLTPDELTKIGGQGFGQQQLVQGGAPGAFQPQAVYR